MRNSLRESFLEEDFLTGKMIQGLLNMIFLDARALKQREEIQWEIFNVSQSCHRKRMLDIANKERLFEHKMNVETHQRTSKQERGISTHLKRYSCKSIIFGTILLSIQEIKPVLRYISTSASRELTV